MVSPLAKHVPCESRYPGQKTGFPPIRLALRACLRGNDKNLHQQQELFTKLTNRAALYKNILLSVYDAADLPVKI